MRPPPPERSAPPPEAEDDSSSDDDGWGYDDVHAAIEDHRAMRQAVTKAADMAQARIDADKAAAVDAEAAPAADEPEADPWADRFEQAMKESLELERKRERRDLDRVRKETDDRTEDQMRELRMQREYKRLWT